MTQEIINLFEPIFENMPEVFTSNAFTKEARRRKIQETIIAQHQQKYLHVVSYQHGSKRIWKKKHDPIQDNSKQNLETKKAEITNAIQLLKAEGYKVIRVIEQQM